MSRHLRALVADTRRALAGEPWLILLAITVVALVVRLLYLDMPMRQDESATVTEFAMRPWRSAWGKYTATNNHILHTLLLKAGMELFGPAPAVVRIPALVAGVLLVPATYLVGVRMYSRTAALLSAVGVAVLPALVFFSVNARGYTMIVLFALLQWLVLRHALRTNNPLSWGAFALLAAAGMFTHLTMAFALGGIGGWALLWLARNRPLAASRLPWLAGAGVASIVATVVLYVPVLYMSGLRALVANDNVRAKSTAVFMADGVELLQRVWVSWSTGLPPWLAALWLAVAAAGAVQGLVSRRTERAWPALAVVFIVVLLLASLRIPPPRSFLVLLPLLLVTFTGVWDRLAEGKGGGVRRVMWGGAFVPFAVMAWAHAVHRPVTQMTETGWLPEGAAVADRLTATLRPGDAIASKWLAKDVVRYYLMASGREAPFLPGTPYQPPHDLYVLVGGADSAEAVLEYARLPRSLAAGARLVDTVGRVRILVVSSPISSR